MDLNEIKKLVKLVEEAQISHLCVEEEGQKIEVRKELQTSSSPVVVSVPQAEVPPAAVPAPAQAATPAPDDLAGLTPITSQMVGSFYEAPSPGAAPFVKVGDRVSQGQVICIIEAMKLFNEIESEVDGIVEKVCVSNGSSVEFGQELFLVRKG